MVHSQFIKVALAALLIGTMSVSAGQKKSSAHHAAKSHHSAKKSTAKKHHIVVHIDSKDPKIQKVALNNTMALIRHFGKKNTQVEIVILGAGTAIPMVFSETSTYADRLKKMAAMPNIRISACNGSMKKFKKRTKKKLTLIKGLHPVPVGVGRIVELEEQGYSYLHP